MSPGARCWYVVQSHPRAEAKAVGHLNRQGFETYLPQYLKRRRHARRITVSPTALFPRYLFVNLDTETQRWRSILSTIGVSRLVCGGETPTPVPRCVIESLRARHDSNGYVQLDAQPKFYPGDKIRVLGGAFTDFLGLYEGIKDSERVAIFLDLLGRKVRVTVDIDSVAAA